MNQVLPFVADRPVSDLIGVGAIIGEPREGAARFWTTREIRVLRENFAVLGVEGCMTLLHGRSAKAINDKAAAEGLAAAVRPKRPRRPNFKWSPQQDAAIHALYAGDFKRGALKQLCLTLGRPLRAVQARALSLGHASPRFKEPDWTEPELEIVRALATSKPRWIRRKLRDAGFNRTEGAIVVKLNRLEVSREELDEDHLTGAGLEMVLGINRRSIPRLVERGLLKARKDRVTSGALVDGDWRIARKDVRDFVIHNVALVDFRRVDKHWLVDLLTNSAASIGGGGRG